MKKCPKCEKLYRDYDQYCVICRYKLKYIEGSKIVDYAPEPHSLPVNVPRVECPYCHSTFTRKISKTSKMLGNSFLEFLLQKDIRSGTAIILTVIFTYLRRLLYQIISIVNSILYL